MILLTIILVLNKLNVISAQRPNVLLVLVDDLGYGDLEYFGHPSSQSPNIDGFAQESLVLTDFYVASPVCSPSRAALLTGKYPVTTGIWPGVLWPNSVGGLNSTHKTLAVRLKEMGYATAHIGKWHLGVGENYEYLPTKRGFDHYLGIPYSHDMCPCLKCFDTAPCYGNCRLDYVGCPLFLDENIVEQPVDLTKLTHKYTESAQAFITESVTNQNPFFLYMAYPQTHFPQFASVWNPDSSRGRFGMALQEMDGSFGEITKTIKNLGIDNNTIIVFTSDNGPSMARQERGGCSGLLRCGKATTFEGGMRVPAMIKWTGMVSPRKSKELVTSLDIVPSIMTLVGGQISPDESLHGLDLSKTIILDQKSKRDHFAYYASQPKEEIGMMALRYKNFKAHFYTKGNALSDDSNYDFNCTSKATLAQHDPPLLYDLSVDPGERYPLNVDANRDILDDMYRIRIELTEKVKWGPSETDGKGKKREAWPCCTDKNSSCEPFPTCCNCPKNH